ncbi:MAG: hypothetical protein ACRD3C_07720 [Vicinamibacterales bacterium]
MSRSRLASNTSTGRDRRAPDYALLDIRVSRRFRTYEVRVEGMNLGDATYQEIVGVAMPGRAVSLSLAVRP